jgi:acyl-CoA synthetase (AMP-forming)/AMP-acid ligase II
VEGAAARRAGIGPGDTLGLLLSNRPEFHIADAGALLLGATPFSMYNTSAPEQLAHLVADADCRVIVTAACQRLIECHCPTAEARAKRARERPACIMRIGFRLGRK